LNRIFEPFARVGTGNAIGSTTGEHLGVCLYIEIVSAHGGMVWTTSERETTRFHVALPVDQNATRPAELLAPELSNIAGQTQLQHQINS
jgi:signal transduction histidine kinase